MRKRGARRAVHKEARDQFLKFAESTSAQWTANFRDLNAAVTRMATLSLGGRITVDNVRDEIARLNERWTCSPPGDNSRALLTEIISADKMATLDLFDQAQLATVLEVCRQSKSLSEAGRKLFSVSRLSKSQPNDADRLRKYLARFDLTWADVS
jgi:transcriptional regulatory protein RtcR